MRDDTIRALARYNHYLVNELRDVGIRLNDARVGDYQLAPGRGMVELTRLAAEHGLLSKPVVGDMITALGADIDADDCTTDNIPVVKQGPYVLEWMQKGDFRTMTVRAAAGALGVSTQRVYALLKEGKLDGVRLPKGQMVYARSVERRLEGNES
jgi:hypothetical protein